MASRASDAVEGGDDDNTISSGVDWERLPETCLPRAKRNGKARKDRKRTQIESFYIVLEKLIACISKMKAVTGRYVAVFVFLCHLLQHHEHIF